MSGPGLLAELRVACEAVTPLYLRHLTALGVSWPTIGELGRHHYGLGVVNASAGDDELYIPGDGERHLLLPVYDDGELVDLCAFRSGDPTRWLLRTGYGWALGLEGGLGPLTWGDPVPLTVSPLEWLQCGARGLCVLDWSAPEVRYLLDIPALVCSSADLAKHLRSALSTPVRFPQISVGETRLAA